VGNDLDRSISAELEPADVILLLVSPDFLASAYCYDIEMQRGLGTASPFEVVYDGSECVTESGQCDRC
jgi:hypothetical protein